jgi:hypothetical protein
MIIQKAKGEKSSEHVLLLGAFARPATGVHCQLFIFANGIQTAWFLNSDR